MKHHVIERSASDLDLQGVHHHEVKGDDVACVMHLRKLHVLLNAALQLPLLHSPFECASDRVFYTSFITCVVLPLKPTQDGIRFDL